MDGLDGVGVQLRVHILRLRLEVRLKASIAPDIQFSWCFCCLYSELSSLLFGLLVIVSTFTPLRRLDLADRVSRENEQKAAEGSRRRYLIHT